MRKLDLQGAVSDSGGFNQPLLRIIQLLNSKIQELVVSESSTACPGSISIPEELMKEAGSAGKPLRIYVESFNRSLGLFERLGFARAAEHGIHLLMEKQPMPNNSD